MDLGGAVMKSTVGKAYARKETAILGVVGVAILCSWLTLRSGGDRLSVEGFDLRFGPSDANTAGPSFLPSRTSLNAGLRGAFARGRAEIPSGLFQPPVAEAAPSRGEARSLPAGEKAEVASPPPEEAKALGLPIDDKSLRRAGAVRGTIEALSGVVIAHPRLMKWLLNNKTFVDAYFTRQPKLCGDAGALKSYLSNGNDPGGVSEEVSLIKAVLTKPESARIALESEAGRRTLECPSIGRLLNDKTAVTSILGANPQLMSYLSDPTALKVVADNASAESILERVQAAQAGF